jgi:hypothetical protein
MKFVRYAVICGHLVEEFRWLGHPTCFVDGHQVSDSFENAVIDIQAAGRSLPKHLSRNTSRWIGGATAKTESRAIQSPEENPVSWKTETSTTSSSGSNTQRA